MDNMDPEYSARMLADIQGLIAERKRQARNQRKAARDKAADGTAAFVNTKAPDYVSPYVAQQQHEEREFRELSPKRKAARRAALKVPTVDDVMDTLFAAPPPKHAIPSEEIQIRSRVVPFMDSLHRIKETTALSDHLDRVAEQYRAESRGAAGRGRTPSPQSAYLPPYSPVRSHPTGPPITLSGFVDTVGKFKEQSAAPVMLTQRPFPSHLTADFLRKRYPRFFTCMKMGDFEVSAHTAYRSDLWMVHFIESCFDDAMSCCDKVHFPLPPCRDVHLCIAHRSPLTAALRCLHLLLSSPCTCGRRTRF
jgi:hypothetical protein